MKKHSKIDVFILTIVVLMFVSSCAPIGQVGEAFGEDDIPSDEEHTADPLIDDFEDDIIKPIKGVTGTDHGDIYVGDDPECESTPSQGGGSGTEKKCDDDTR